MKKKICEPLFKQIRLEPGAVAGSKGSVFASHGQRIKPCRDVRPNNRPRHLVRQGGLGKARSGLVLGGHTKEARGRRPAVMEGLRPVPRGFLLRGAARAASPVQQPGGSLASDLA